MVGKGKEACMIRLAAMVGVLGMLTTGAVADNATPSADVAPAQGRATGDGGERANSGSSESPDGAQVLPLPAPDPSTENGQNQGNRALRSDQKPAQADPAATPDALRK